MAEKVPFILADQIEPSSGVLGTIEFEHFEIHMGKSFTVSFDNDVTNTNEMSAIAFNVPDDVKKVHMIITASGTSLTQFNLYESPSIDVDEGTEKDIINRKFESVTTSILTSIETAPVANKVTTYNETQAANANITTTTEKWSETIGQSGNPISKSGGQSRGTSEFILYGGRQYVVVLKALDANDNHHNIILDWYEQIPVSNSIEYTRSIV